MGPDAAEATILRWCSSARAAGASIHALVCLLCPIPKREVPIRTRAVADAKCAGRAWRGDLLRADDRVPLGGGADLPAAVPGRKVAHGRLHRGVAGHRTGSAVLLRPGAHDPCGIHRTSS